MRERAAVAIDDSKWPRVYATWPSQTLDDDAFAAMVDKMSSFATRGQAYVIIHDARKAARPTATQRALAAEAQKRDAERTKKWLRGVAMIVSNPVIVGALTAINWISPPPYPQKTFSAMADAEAWATAQLESAR